MRLQLMPRLRAVVALVTLGASAASVFAVVPAHAQVAELGTSHTVYHEAPTRTNMTVYTPGVDLAATPAEWITVRAGWEADVVSGASVATKAGRSYQDVNPGVDVVTTASVKDVRNAARGGFTLRKGDVAYTGGYTYATENDYKSHALVLSARTDAYGHNTQLELSYARNFDLVCDRVQATSDRPPRFRAMEDSSGCFSGNDPLRTRHALAIDGLEAAWTQAWTPTFATQLAYTAQILDGFQSSPYRAVVLAQGLKAQEHHPETRVRQSIALRVNLYLRPIKLALKLSGRAYRDTWDLTSGTGEIEAEKYLAQGLRVSARARYYRQSGAVFFSDDYTGGDPPLGPKGQYWTGDRELSPFTSVLGGLRLTYATEAAKGRILGLMTGFKAGMAFDVMQFDYDEFTLGGVPITNARVYILGLNLSGSF